LGFRVWGSGFRAWGLGFRAWGLGFRAWGLGRTPLDQLDGHLVLLEVSSVLDLLVWDDKRSEGDGPLRSPPAFAV
jgi:hypothetical protein